MIQLNLLPDVKIAFIKARAQKRLVILFSTIIAAAALAICILLFTYVNVVQKKSSSDLSKDITSNSNELTSTKDLNKILTVQNQLMSLDGLHNQKPATDRLAGYIAKTTSQGISINQFDIDFAAKTVTVSGRASNLEEVNRYVDSLKATVFLTKENEKDSPTPAFTDVVLSSFARSDTDTSFTVNFAYDEIIFDANKNVAISVGGVPVFEGAPADSSSDAASSFEGEQ